MHRGIRLCLVQPPPSNVATCFANCKKNGCPLAIWFATPLTSAFSPSLKSPGSREGILTFRAPSTSAIPLASLRLWQFIRRRHHLSRQVSLYLRSIESIQRNVGILLQCRSVARARSAVLLLLGGGCGALRPDIPCRGVLFGRLRGVLL